MPLSAQRLQSSETLRRCVDEGYRMMAGEPDQDAVKRMQLALYDLGYTDIERVDGIWAGKTDDIVRLFKHDEGLAPGDAVASRGTIGQLDIYFAGEAADPDDPDPGVEGLTDLVRTEMSELVIRIDQAFGLLNVISWGTPGDVAESPWRSALLTHCGIDASEGESAMPPARILLERRLNNMRDALGRDLIVVLTEDRASWHASTGYSFYSASAFRQPDRVLTVTPAFRNALTESDRLATILRAGLRTFEPQVVALGYPGTARYGWLEPHQREVNAVGIAALILSLTGDEWLTLHPAPIWGDLSSFPGA